MLQQTQQLLTNVERNNLFGQFNFKQTPNTQEIAIDPQWVQHNIINLNIPQLIGKRGCKTGNILINKKCVKQFVNLFETLEKNKLMSKIVSVDCTWSPKFVGDSITELSSHAWGSAIDFNAAYNKLGELPAQLGEYGTLLEIVDFAAKNGFIWGGNCNPLNGKHFEVKTIL